ncbi:MAG: hypothetical protein GX796_04765 [Clostridiaceae bacterium]|nr:hypothetical protein [Clostridiaceae bacterium]
MENKNLKKNGQSCDFKGYGGIEDPERYVKWKYGQSWIESETATILKVENFTQASFETDSNNCVLASITRVMKYYNNIGYTNIPTDAIEIYKTVKNIGVKYGYDPIKTGVMRDLFIYTPWVIDDIVKDTWKAFNYTKGDGCNDYFSKLKTIKNSIDKSNPLLLNIAFGDYKNHTVSVIGFKIYSKKGLRDKVLIQIYDGWSSYVRYIDWTKLGSIPTSITRILPPLEI